MKKLLLGVILLLFVVSLSACKEDTISFVLIGEDVVHLTTGTPYTEKGYMVRDDGEDISEYVTLAGDIVPTESGNYTVTYTLDYKGQETILERFVYYREEGCQAIHETNVTECVTYWTEYLHTAVKLKLYYEDDTYHDQVHYIFGHVEYMIWEYHQLSDKYNEYEDVVNVMTINNDPTTTHTIDPRLFEMIEFSLDHQDEVDQRFNIALGPVLRVWHDYREACNIMIGTPVCEVPTIAELTAPDAFTDPAGITLDGENHTITMQDNMSLDLGGMSKGFISGKIMEYLDGLDFSGYLLNNGESNISIGGTHPTRENGKFLLAITDPTFETQFYATVFLNDGDQLVTSGDYQQYYLVDDEVYHHIINPTTLFPDRTCRSVSIITSDPALADIYSTAIFTMSMADGLTFVDTTDGLEAIWFGIDGTIQMSANFATMYLNELTE